MTEAATGGDTANPWLVVAGSLLPTVAFFVPTALAGAWGDDGLTSAGGLGGTLLFCLGFITFPCLLALVAARPGSARRVTLIALTLLAAGAAAAVLLVEDAQAGLNVLLIPGISLPLALVLWISRVFTRRSETAEPTAE